jgi:cytochrome c peroxidase
MVSAMKHSKSFQIMVIASFALAFTALARANGAAELASGFEFKLPFGMPAEVWSYYVPKDNPLTEAKIALGKELFFDKRLSADGTVNCATCHDPKLAFTDGKRFSDGINGRRGKRNSPTLLNAMFNSGQFWDGRAETLEEQAILPLIDADEMGNRSHDEVVARLQTIPEYTRQFREVFNSKVTIQAIAKALATFERTLVSADSPFDRFIAGNRDAMTEAARRGMLIFRTKARCNICHNINQSFPFLTDQNFRNTGVAANHSAFDGITRKATEMTLTNNSASLLRSLSTLEGGSELGRFVFTGNSLDIGAFRTPSLRNVELTAPYFHDGSAATLADVVRYYVKGGNEHPLRDWELNALSLAENEQSDLVEFLKSLTSYDAKTMVEPSAQSVSR